MRDPKRIPIVLEAFQRLWERHPDSRFMQLASNLIPHGRDGFFIEDDELMDIIKEDVLYGGRKDGFVKDA